jgi:UDP-N-acetylmuramate dehydrogenase
MEPRQNVSLRDYSTMRLGGNAAYLCDASSRQELVDAVNWAEERELEVMVIGGGSNIVWRDEGYGGLIIVNKIMRYEDFAEDEYNHYVTIGAGENWDSVVERTVAAGLSGIECLSLVPGTAGATPIQNVGAYGQEIAHTLVTVEAYDRQTKGFVNVPNEDCDFSYRSSKFKTTERGRYLISALTLHLTTAKPEPPFYGSVQNYLDEHGIHEYTAGALRQAVIDIRSHKLPDPAVVANNGSFFANPIVSRGEFVQIQADFPEAPHWQTSDDRMKLSAAWLIEQVGFKGVHDEETGMATWPNQPLVFVNEAAKSTADLIAFRQKILDAVQQRFGITLVQEPELLP